MVHKYAFACIVYQPKLAKKKQYVPYIHGYMLQCNTPFSTPYVDMDVKSFTSLLTDVLNPYFQKGFVYSYVASVSPSHSSPLAVWVSVDGLTSPPSIDDDSE
jgi:hypothetical protein